jgi:hypothetical protein
VEGVPLLAGYTAGTVAGRPDLAGIRLRTLQGALEFVATRGMIERMSADLARLATKLAPDRSAD